MKCGDCRYFDTVTYRGICRLNPPAIYVFHDMQDCEIVAEYWPETDAEMDWCGQFVPNTQDVTDNRDEWEKGPVKS